MARLSLAVGRGLPVFGPGFAGGRWVAGAGEVDALSVSPQKVPDDLFSRIDRFCAEIPPDGAVGGFIGYEAAAALMPDLDLPAAPDRLPVVHLRKFERRLEITATPVSRAGRTLGHARTDDDPSGYEDKVTRVIAAILDGEIFQANISRRLSAEFAARPDLAGDLFCRLIERGAAAYAAFVPTEGGAVLSNSPELFLQVAGRAVVAEPIKGTAPRGADPVSDRDYAAALVESVKDRAENVMIADLLRNDLAKVCADGSISEPQICALRTLPAVHHLYSRIEGRLRDGLGAIDALRAAFPCGSVTGAPKHRAMQVISRLEGEGRGPYCGTVLFMPAEGPAVFSVSIRTAALSVGRASARLDYRTGGGVTALSDAEAEYRETEAKAYGFEAMVR